MTHRTLVEQLYRAAVQSADPRTATRDAVIALGMTSAPAILAVGKAARAMCEGALEGLGAGGLECRFGLIVSETGEPPSVGALPHLRGDHPVPGQLSYAAATALHSALPHAHELGAALVLVSGGTTSLIAQAVEGVSATDLAFLFDALLRSGAPITDANVVRRRLLRWGGGRLAVALNPARVHCLVVSDVMGNDLAAIGSGPCVGDSSTVADVRGVLRKYQLTAPASVDEYLRRVEDGAEPETPKPHEARLLSVGARVVLDNSSAVSAVRHAGARLGLERLAVQGPLAGEASELGAALGSHLAHAAKSLGRRRLLVSGGEPTVTIAGGADGTGGRCQELALAAARELHAAGVEHRVTLLAAGTDGRDGPTDAAGAVVDGFTWARIVAAGRDPAIDLAGHNAYAALDAAGALLRSGSTGTNVNDVIIAVVGDEGFGRPVSVG